jgi:DNA-binding transcriptional MerR regulator
MAASYSTKRAAELTGASRQALRVYTARYSRYMSTEATPEHGGERRFTEADLKLMAYIYR